MPIHTTRRNLAGTLFSYGEDQLAITLTGISPAQMDEIADKADGHSSGTGLLATALALAAVEVLEGKPRPLARSRRRLAEASRADGLVFVAWPKNFWGTIMERIAGD